MERFKDSKRFGEMIKELDVRLSSAYFKINILKLPQKYPKLKKSSLILNFFKSYLKTIKEVCKENGTDIKLFYQVKIF